MLDVEGRVRLMDFGIAKQQGVEVTSGSVTATGMVLGTPEYMSPEQARGKKIDFRSDIYALGIIGYELFTGRVPFKGETPLETLFKHLQEMPVFSRPESPGIPAPVIPVLRKALAKDSGRAVRQRPRDGSSVAPGPGRGLRSVADREDPAGPDRDRSPRSEHSPADPDGSHPHSGPDRRLPGRR